MVFKFIAKSDVKYFMVFIIILFLAFVIYSYSKSSVFEIVKIKKGEQISLELDFEVAIMCKIFPYDKLVTSKSEIINSRLNDFLSSQNFRGNSEYQISILFADNSINRIKGITLPDYNELKVSIDTKQNFQFNETCISFIEPSKSVYITR